MTPKEFNRRKATLELRNRDIEQRMKLDKIKNKYKKPSKKLITTSKLIILIVFAICIEILIFVERYSWKYGDSSALYALVGVPVALIPPVISYFSKSKAENTEGGITYEMAMMNAKENEQPKDVAEQQDGPVG